MDASFILTKMALEELRKMGYTEVWIGKTLNPHWPDHGCDNFIIAAPKIKIHGGPGVWSGSEQVFGSMGCGNGLRNADQCQRENVRKMIAGHYVLIDGEWNTEKFLEIPGR